MIGIGLVGVQPGRSWGAIAHEPALRAVPGYRLAALSTTKPETAAAAANELGVAKAYADHESLARDPDVDLVVIAVKVPHHLEIARAAIAAGKHVYCEWPLANGLAEAEALEALARRSQVRTFVGLQARVAPPLVYAGDLIRSGLIGEVLGVSVIGSGMNWGAVVEQANAYTLDRRNGATMLTIPVLHTLDGLCSVLGEIKQVSARLAHGRRQSVVLETGQTVEMTSEDQVALVGELEGGATLSCHYRGGVSKGTNLLVEINGSRGDLLLRAAGGHAQLFDLSIQAAGADDPELKTLATPESYYHTALRAGPAVNVAEAYVRVAADLRDGGQSFPDFAHGLRRHRLIEAVLQSAETGERREVR